MTRRKTVAADEYAVPASPTTSVRETRSRNRNASFSSVNTQTAQATSVVGDETPVPSKVTTGQEVGEPSPRRPSRAAKVKGLEKIKTIILPSSSQPRAARSRSPGESERASRATSRNHSVRTSRNSSIDTMESRQNTRRSVRKVARDDSGYRDRHYQAPDSPEGDTITVQAAPAPGTRRSTRISAVGTSLQMGPPSTAPSRRASGARVLGYHGSPFDLSMFEGKQQSTSYNGSNGMFTIKFTPKTSAENTAPVTAQSAFETTVMTSDGQRTGNQASASKPEPPKGESPEGNPVIKASSATALKSGNTAEPVTPGPSRNIKKNRPKNPFKSSSKVKRDRERRAQRDAERAAERRAAEQASNPPDPQETPMREPVVVEESASKGGLSPSEQLLKESADDGPQEGKDDFVASPSEITMAMGDEDHLDELILPQDEILALAGSPPEEEEHDQLLREVSQDLDILHDPGIADESQEMEEDENGENDANDTGPRVRLHFRASPEWSENRPSRSSGAIKISDLLTTDETIDTSHRHSAPLDVRPPNIERSPHCSPLHAPSPPARPASVPPRIHTATSSRPERLPRPHIHAPIYNPNHAPIGVEPPRFSTDIDMMDTSASIGSIATDLIQQYMSEHPAESSQEAAASRPARLAAFEESGIPTHVHESVHSDLSLPPNQSPLEEAKIAHIERPTVRYDGYVSSRQGSPIFNSAEEEILPHPEHKADHMELDDPEEAEIEPMEDDERGQASSVVENGHAEGLRLPATLSGDSVHHSIPDEPPHTNSKFADRSPSPPNINLRRPSVHRSSPSVPDTTADKMPEPSQLDAYPVLDAELPTSENMHTHSPMTVPDPLELQSQKHLQEPDVSAEPMRLQNGDARPCDESREINDSTGNLRKEEISEQAVVPEIEYIPELEPEENAEQTLEAEAPELPLALSNGVDAGIHQEPIIGRSSPTPTKEEPIDGQAPVTAELKTGSHNPRDIAVADILMNMMFGPPINQDQLAHQQNEPILDTSSKSIDGAVEPEQETEKELEKEVEEAAEKEAEGGTAVVAPKESTLVILEKPRPPNTTPITRELADDTRCPSCDTTLDLILEDFEAYTELRDPPITTDSRVFIDHVERCQDSIDARRESLRRSTEEYISQDYDSQPEEPKKKLPAHYAESIPKDRTATWQTILHVRLTDPREFENAYKEAATDEERAVVAEHITLELHKTQAEFWALEALIRQKRNEQPKPMFGIINHKAAEPEVAQLGRGRRRKEPIDPLRNKRNPQTTPMHPTSFQDTVQCDLANWDYDPSLKKRGNQEPLLQTGRATTRQTATSHGASRIKMVHPQYEAGDKEIGAPRVIGKPRGRPPKAQNEGSSSRATTQPLVSNRGTPSASATPATAPAIIQTQPAPTNGALTITDPPRRKRGRPKKNPDPVPAVVPGAVAAPRLPEVPTKKRSRVSTINSADVGKPRVTPSEASATVSSDGMLKISFTDDGNKSLQNVLSRGNTPQDGANKNDQAGAEGKGPRKRRRTTGPSVSAQPATPGVPHIAADGTITPAPVKRGPGRPRGSTNKPKVPKVLPPHAVPPPTPVPRQTPTVLPRQAAPMAAARTPQQLPTPAPFKEQTLTFQQPLSNPPSSSSALPTPTTMKRKAPETATDLPGGKRMRPTKETRTNILKDRSVSPTFAVTTARTAVDCRIVPPIQAPMGATRTRKPKRQNYAYIDSTERKLTREEQFALAAQGGKLDAGRRTRGRTREASVAPESTLLS